jgi:hypothetical protein
MNNFYRLGDLINGLYGEIYSSETAAEKALVDDVISAHETYREQEIQSWIFDYEDDELDLHKFTLSEHYPLGFSECLLNALKIEDEKEKKSKLSDLHLLLVKHFHYIAEVNSEGKEIEDQ